MLGRLKGVQIEFKEDVTDEQRASLVGVLEWCEFIWKIEDWYEDEPDEFDGAYTVTEYADRLTDEGITFNGMTAYQILEKHTPQIVGKKMKKEYQKCFRKLPKTKPFNIERSDGSIDTVQACVYTEDDHDFFVMCMLKLAFGEPL